MSDDDSCPCDKPLKFKSPQALQNKIDAYFKECDDRKRTVLLKTGETADIPDPRPYTISGLAVALDTSRRVLMEYSSRHSYSNTITRAKAKIQAFGEESLWTPGISHGVVMSLTNSFGWRQKHEIDSKVTGNMTTRTDTSQLSDAELDAKILSLVGTVVTSTVPIVVPDAGVVVGKPKPDRTAKRSPKKVTAPRSSGRPRATKKR